MLLRRLLPIAVVLAGLSVLALLGHGWIVRDRDARREEVAGDAREEERTLVDRAGRALASLAVDLRTARDGERRFVGRDGTVLPGPVPARASTRLEAALALGARLDEAGEPLRAIDALTMALPELEAPRDRDRLLLAAGRIALTTDAMRAWGLAILERLATTPDLAAGAEPPIDLVAALALPPERAPTVTAAMLSDRLATSPAVVIAALAGRFATRPGWRPDPRLEERLAAAHAIDRAVRLAVDAVVRGVPALASGFLVLPTGERGAGGIAVAVGDARTLLPAAARPFEGMWGPPTGVPAVAVEGTPVASLSLVDPTAATRLAAIDTRATRLRLLLFAVLAVVGVAVCATWFAIDRQRRLAALRMRLLANVSHELKTPVTSIRMLGELLEGGQLPPERVTEFGKLITRESQRLGTRIEEILETARGERSSAPLPRTAVAVASTVGEVVAAFRDRVAAVHGRLAFSPGETDPTVETNRDALERIVENLIDNAMKYGANGSGGPAIDVTVEGTERAARVIVDDHGPGIPSEERARIFEPFYRARFDDFEVAGTGLGLSISRSFAERLGGTLEVDARPGGGSRFTLTLPTTPEGSAA